jgi:hypothetical protein
MTPWLRKNDLGTVSRSNLRNEPYLVTNFVFTMVILLIITYAGIFSPDKNNYPVRCIHEELTGETCASCGVSHSFSLILRGRFTEAYEYNKYGMRLFIFFVSQLFLRIFFSGYYINNPGIRRQLILFDITGSSVIFLIAFLPYMISIFRWF